MHVPCLHGSLCVWACIAAEGVGSCLSLELHTVLSQCGCWELSSGTSARASLQPPSEIYYQVCVHEVLHLSVGT